MKIILQQEVAGLGHKGEIKEVKPGYALNFLLPRGLAVLATASGLKRLEQAHSRQAEKAEAAKARVLALMPQLQKTPLVFKRKAKAGKLFGSVTRSDIAQEIGRLLGLRLPVGGVRLERSLKTLGDFPVTVILPGEIEVRIRVLVEEE